MSSNCSLGITNDEQAQQTHERNASPISCDVMNINEASLSQQRHSRAGSILARLHFAANASNVPSKRRPWYRDTSLDGRRDYLRTTSFTIPRLRSSSRSRVASINGSRSQSRSNHTCNDVEHDYTSGNTENLSSINAKKKQDEFMLNECIALWNKKCDTMNFPHSFVDSLATVLSLHRHLLVDVSALDNDDEHRYQAANTIKEVCKQTFGLNTALVVLDRSSTPESLIHNDQYDENSTQKIPTHLSKRVAYRGFSLSASSRRCNLAATAPIFSDVLVCHNLHLVSVDTAAIILEAMRMRLVSVRGHKRDLSPDFCVIATYDSTYIDETDQPLHDEHRVIEPPFSRHFRRHFLMQVYLDENIFRQCLQNSVGIGIIYSRPILGMKTIQSLRKAQSVVFICPALRQYTRDIAIAVGQHPTVAIGPGPLGANNLQDAARVHALLSGYSYVRPLDIDVVAVSLFAHTLILNALVDGGSRHLVHDLVFNNLSPPK